MVRRPPWSYLIAICMIAAMTELIKLTHADASMANVPMLYLIAVTATSFICGSLPAVFASVLAFAGFDWFFVEPHYQLSVKDPAEWLALLVFLLTATLTGQLTASLRERAEQANRQKSELEALADASWAVVSELDRDRAVGVVMSQLIRIVNPDYAAVFIGDPNMETKMISEFTNPSIPAGAPHKISDDAVKLAITEGKQIGWDSNDMWKLALEEPAAVYLPILLDNQPMGVIHLRFNSSHHTPPGDQQVLKSLLNHIAVILQRDRLMKEQARAQALAEADKLKTAILSMVSHDFRSPLTSIKASAGSLLEEEHPVDHETQLSLLQAIVEETDRLNRMVGNVLDLSRLEAGAWQPRRETIDIPEIIGSALDSLSETDNERIIVNMEPAIDGIAGDAVQMVQVVRNLLENALKYSPQATEVELRVGSHSGIVCIDVLDHGPGLPEGEEQQIFRPFYRARGLNESSVPGVGIGLALCRGLVEANGGTLTATNREGGGAQFRVSFPKSAPTYS